MAVTRRETALPEAGGIVDDRTQPSRETRAAEAADAQAHAEADDMPTEEEAAAAERAGTADPEVAEHYEEMAQRGADQQGEGRIP
jgi:hypothetical protein